MNKDGKHSESSKAKKQATSKETIYVVDTNVIISDPNFVKKLRGKILIPKTVLQELDKHKYGTTEKARNTREFARYLDRNEHRVWFHDSDQYEGSNDEKIVKTAKILESQGHSIVLVTNDILMSLMAKSIGLTVKKHDLSRTDRQELYKGFKDLRYKYDDPSYYNNYRPNPNEYELHEDGLHKKLANGKLVKLGKDPQIWNIRHKNVEQRCAIDALLDPNISLVTITGKAGTGKTLLAIAAGLEQVINKNKFQKLIVSRPVVPMGQDLGYLPGELSEKLNPWMQPIFDNIDFLFSLKDKRTNNEWEKLVQEGFLKLEALSYIRGRSIPNQYIIIDEAQNLTRHEVKTIISRAGHNTKIIMTGDIHQIDNPRLDAFNNGLTYAIEKFKNQKIAAHINLENCERSELAEIASEIL
jgi:PhoH-like ATPase